MITNNQIIEELKKFHSRYHNKFKNGKVFWEEYYKELNRLLQEKDGWTQKAIDECSFKNFPSVAHALSYNNKLYGLHGKKGCEFCKDKTNQANYL